MSIEHSTIPDAGRHEDKHASTAAAGAVKIANGDGTTKFDVLPYASLSGKPMSIAYKQKVFGFSTAASQQPSATNTVLQVEFGALQTTTDVVLAADGTITFVTAGQYLVEVFLRYGRTAGAGNAIIFQRFKKNGSQVVNSNALVLADSTNIATEATTRAIDASAADTLTIEILRDSAGINNGGLFQTTASAGGWSSAPSASIIISKFNGLA